MQLNLTHNPYRIETTFLINDKKCDALWFRSLTEENGAQKRLQMWIMDFFFALKKEIPDETVFDLFFSGVSTDCDDIIDEAKIAEDKLKISIKVHIKECSDSENKFLQLQELYKEATSGRYDGFKYVELNKAFEEITSRELSISVMAPMKNGKSTLLNAIIGHEILPNQPLRCTAKISYIENEPAATHFEAKCLRNDNSDPGYIPCNLQLLKEWNNDDEVKRVIIRGKLFGISTQDYKLRFIDTPGPDSAIYKEDCATIERFLNDHSLPMVCYIIDILNDSEVAYLKRLKEHMSTHGKQSEDRFLFIVTKMDIHDIPKDSTHDCNPIKKIIDNIRHDLHGIGIANPRIFPVSSLIALKARICPSITNTEDLEDFEDSFKNFYKKIKRTKGTLNDYVHLSRSVRESLTAELDIIESKIATKSDTISDYCRYMEILSGIPALEKTIEEYLLKYSVPARIADAAKAFEEAISQAKAEQVLIKDIESKKTDLSQITEHITNLRHALRDGDKAKDIRRQIAAKQWEESREFKNMLSETDRDLNMRIDTKISEWKPDIDSNGYVEAAEASKMLNDFKSFMDGISNELLGVYANAVENDVHYQFNEMKQLYNDHIKIIIGEMPGALQNFVNRLDFVRRTIIKINLQEQDIIEECQEKYTVSRKREITFKDDGFLEGLVSWMPFTNSHKSWEETCYRTKELVQANKLRKELRYESSVILQKSIEGAKEAAQKQYQNLKKVMLKEFDKVDLALNQFNRDLEMRISNKEQTEAEYRASLETLNWVQDFQGRLARVLDIN